MDSSDVIQVIILLVLLFLSAFFSSAETAMTTVNRIRIRSLADDGNARAKTLLKITDDPAKFLSAILIGNNIVNLSAASLTTSLAYGLGGSMVAIASGILTLLILLFGDYRKPAVILCCIPLLGIGVVGAMLLTGKVFTFCAIVGALGLVGMMMKNCIVLMDEITLQIGQGTEPITALIDSAQSRLRPVMMAALTTILGMIPLLTDAMFGSLAASIMGGLLFGTVITLVFIPVLYALFFHIKHVD